MEMCLEYAGNDVTGLLIQWRQGDREALDALIPVVYRDLRRLARIRLRAESGAPSVRPTGLVHEVYLRISDAGTSCLWARGSHRCCCPEWRRPGTGVRQISPG